MVKIDGKTMTCGLLGNPVEHTMSPAIHNTLAELQGHSLVYVPFLVDHGKLGQAVAGARALHIKGLNVTVPYKTEVMQYVKELDPLAQQIGAVNTLVETEEVFLGRDFAQTRNYSEETAAIIDEEVKKIIDKAYKRAQEILTEHMDKLQTVAGVLLEKEKIDGDEFEAIFA